VLKNSNLATALRGRYFNTVSQDKPVVFTDVEADDGDRVVFTCRVMGSTGCGKTSFVRGLIGKGDTPSDGEEALTIKGLTLPSTQHISYLVVSFYYLSYYSLSSEISYFFQLFITHTYIENLSGIRYFLGIRKLCAKVGPNLFHFKLTQTFVYFSLHFQLQESNWDPVTDAEIDPLETVLEDCDAACLLYDTSQPQSFQTAKLIFVSTTFLLIW